MKLHSISDRSWRQLVFGLHRIPLILGVLIMILGNAHAAPVFLLKPASAYFDDPATLALLDAALAGDLTRARTLVAEGSNPNDEGPKSQPINRIDLLDYSIAAGNSTAIKVLVAVGADPERIHQGPGNAFLFAMKLQRLDLFELLLDLRPVATLSKDTMEYLMFEANNRETLAVLLKKGAPIDFPDGAGNTILIMAMSAQNYDLAEWILLQGASVTVETKAGLTPAYSVEFFLKKFRPGSPTHDKVLRLKALMEARGATFPAPDPQAVRERRMRRDRDGQGAVGRFKGTVIGRAQAHPGAND